MLSRRHLFVALGVLIALVVAAFVGTATQAQRRQDTAVRAPNQPPTVVLESDTQTVTVCPGVAGESTARLRLRATARSPEGRTIRYRWTTSAGRLEDEDGPTPTWDLTGVAPGVYTATVEVNTGVEGDACMAFTSIPVAVVACAPPRPICPNVSIYCPDTATAGSTVTFTAEVSGGAAGATPGYNWRVSEGRIVSGQGTPSITVDTAGLGGRAITATVEVMGYNLECRATCTSQIPALPVGNKFDVYNDVRFNDEKARLDNFAVQLQNEPGAQGYILAYGSRRGRPDEGRRRAERARNYLVNERGLSSDRIVIVEGGPRDILTIELWSVPTGATPPRPTP